jgi:hypothetical protein
MLGNIFLEASLFWGLMIAASCTSIAVGFLIALRCRDSVDAFLVGMLITLCMGMLLGVGLAYLSTPLYSSGEGWMTPAGFAWIVWVWVDPPSAVIVGLICFIKRKASKLKADR